MSWQRFVTKNAAPLAAYRDVIATRALVPEWHHGALRMRIEMKRTKMPLARGLLTALAATADQAALVEVLNIGRAMFDPAPVIPADATAAPLIDSIPINQWAPFAPCVVVDFGSGLVEFVIATWFSQWHALSLSAGLPEDYCIARLCWPRTEGDCLRPLGAIVDEAGDRPFLYPKSLPIAADEAAAVNSAFHVALNTIARKEVP